MKQDMSPTHISENLSFKKMISFTLPIVVLTISTQVVTYYLMFYYTDVAMLPVGAISAIFFVCRIYDALNDLYFGFFINKTRSRHGLYRPYILWTAIPLAITSVLLFWTPNFSAGGKIIYVIVAYFVWNTIVSVLSIAMNAMFPLVATSEIDRVRLNSFRLAATILCILFISTFTMPLVQFLGNGNLQTGFLLSILLLSLIGLPLQLLGFRTIEEKQYIKQKKVSFLKGTLLIMQDKGMAAITFMYFFFWIGDTFRSQSVIHYMTYVLKKPEYVSVFFFVAIGVPFLMQFSFRYLVKIIKPPTLAIIGLLGSIIGTVLMLLSGDNITLLLFSNVIFGVASAMPANLVFIMFAGKVDKLSERHNVNLSSMIFSFMSFFSKIGIGIGGTGVALVLSYVNYVPNTDQSYFAISGITFNFIWGTVIGFVLAFVCMLFYIKFEKEE